MAYVKPSKSVDALFCALKYFALWFEIGGKGVNKYKLVFFFYLYLLLFVVELEITKNASKCQQEHKFSFEKVLQKFQNSEGEGEMGG